MGWIQGINHIAFAVKDLDESIKSAAEILGGELIIKFESTEQKYIGACIQLGENIIIFEINIKLWNDGQIPISNAHVDNFLF